MSLLFHTQINHGHKEKNKEEDKMKFLKTIVSIIVVISILVCIPSVSFSQSMGYSEKYDRILHRIEELCEYANLIAEINTIMWQKDGPEKIGNDINIMLRLNVNSYSNDDAMVLIKALGVTSDYMKAFEYTLYYQLAYASLLTDEQKAGMKFPSVATILTNDSFYDIEDVKNDIKALRDIYNDTHSNGIQALRNYYIKLESYAEFATNPSGNLMNYRSNHQTFEREMSELKSNAEFDK